MRILLALSGLLLGYSCLSTQFLYISSECIECNSMIENCDRCTGGDYADIINGSFEEPEISSYQEFLVSIPGWGSEGNHLGLTQESYEGSQSLVLSGNSERQIYQFLETEKDQLYMIEFYLHPRQQETAELSFSVDDFILSSMVLNYTSWTYYSYNIKATGNYSKITFESKQSNVLIDAVKYYNLPQCVECQTGFYLTINQCLRCPEESCINCYLGETTVVCSECTEGHFILEGSCSQCGDFCKQCLDQQTCIECKESFTATDGACECPIYYVLNNPTKECIYHPLEFDIERSAQFIKISFSEELAYTLDENNVPDRYFLPGMREFEISVTKKTSVSYEFQILCEIPDDIENIYFRLKNVIGVSGSVIIKEERDVIIDVQPSFEELEEDPTFLGIMRGFISALCLSIITGQPNVLWNYINFSLMLYYLPLQYKEMPTSLKEFCKGFGVDIFDIMFSLEELFSIDPSSYPRAPEHWAEYEIETTSFYVNAGNIIIAVFLSMCSFPVLGLCFVLAKVLCPACKKWFLDKMKEFRWNFFLRTSVETYLELMAFSFLYVSTIDSQGLTVEMVISFTLIVYGILVIPLLVIFTYRNLNRIAEGNIKSAETYYEEFKKDKFYYHFYYPLFYSRRIIFICGVFLAAEYPLVQAVLNMFLSVITIAYIVVVRPFKKTVDMLLYTMSEVFLGISYGLTWFCQSEYGKESVKEITLLLQVCVIFIVFSNFLVFFIILTKSILKCFRKNAVVQPAEYPEVNPSERNLFELGDQEILECA